MGIPRQLKQICRINSIRQRYRICIQMLCSK